LIPFARLDYTLEDNSSAQFDFYPMIDLLVDTINTQTYRDLKNVERYFVFDNKGDVFIVQQRMLDGYFRPIEYFLN